VRVDAARFELAEPGVYATVQRDGRGEAASEPVDLDLDMVASTVFGSIYIS
jgi:hypothetical protein